MLFPLLRKLSSQACARLTSSLHYDLSLNASPSLTTQDPVNTTFRHLPLISHLRAPLIRMSAPRVQGPFWFVHFIPSA